MATDFQQTDTATRDGPGQYCSSVATAGTTEQDKRCEIGGSAGVTGVTCAAGADPERRVLYFESLPGDLDGVSVSADNWTIKVNVKSAQAQAGIISKCHVCRLSAAGANLETIGSWSGSISISAGVKTITVSGAATTFDTNQTFMCVIVQDATSFLANGWDVTPDQLITVPTVDLDVAQLRRRIEEV